MAFLRRFRAVKFRIGWWRLHSMVGGHAQVSHRRLLGLTRATFYIPHRLRRQYGLAQRIPPKDDLPPEEHSISDRYVERWTNYWAKGLRWTEPRIPESTYITDYYREWSTSFDADKKVLLRQLEREEITGRPAPTQGVTIREPCEAPPKRKEVEGKGKGKMKDEGKSSKKWKKDDGSSSGK